MSDMRIWVEANELFTYPDVSIVCEDLKFYSERRDTITNPAVIFEVLSKSTKNYDRGEKFEFYRTIPTLRDYILVDQYKIHVEHFHIGKDGNWVLVEYNHQDDILKLTRLDVQLQLPDIYRKIAFESA